MQMKSQAAANHWMSTPVLPTHYEHLSDPISSQRSLNQHVRIQLLSKEKKNLYKEPVDSRRDRNKSKNRVWRESDNVQDSQEK